MHLGEFRKQDNYCRANIGCEGCPASDKEHCADALRKCAVKLLQAIGTPQFKELSNELYRDYGITPYHQLALVNGIIEFPS